MNLTNHAKERINERCGLNKKSAKRLAIKALESGISHKDTVGSLNRYLTKLFFVNTNANNIKLYGEYIFVFADELLITVMCLPNEYKKEVNKIRKRLTDVE